MTTRFILSDFARHEQLVKKSRFVAKAAPVSDEALARSFIAAHSDPSANHNCWAWRVGDLYRFSDDGEPGGTAGKPILQAIDGQSLDHVAVVVTRWFGGVLLGSGGLVRAYGGTAAMCLREAEKARLLETTTAVVFVAFSDAALVQGKLSAEPTVQVVKQTFTADGAELTIAVEKTALDLVASLISDLTSGRSSLCWDA